MQTFATIWYTVAYIIAILWQEMCIFVDNTLTIIRNIVLMPLQRLKGMRMRTQYKILAVWLLVVTGMIVWSIYQLVIAK